MRVMKPLNTWLSLENGFVLDDNTAYLADILQAIPLTLALKALNPQFSVDLLHLGASAVTEDEQVYIPAAAGYSREVALCLEQNTVVWARSVCSANDSAWHEIMDCGTLPLGMAANVCAQGARFWFLEVPMQATQRGQELSAALMTEMGCRLTEFEVKRVPAAGE